VLEIPKINLSLIMAFNYSPYSLYPEEAQPSMSHLDQ